VALLAGKTRPGVQPLARPPSAIRFACLGRRHFAPCASRLRPPSLPRRKTIGGLRRRALRISPRPKFHARFRVPPRPSGSLLAVARRRGIPARVVFGGPLRGRFIASSCSVRGHASGARCALRVPDLSGAAAPRPPQKQPQEPQTAPIGSGGLFAGKPTTRRARLTPRAPWPYPRTRSPQRAASACPKRGPTRVSQTAKSPTIPPFSSNPTDPPIS